MEKTLSDKIIMNDDGDEHCHVVDIMRIVKELKEDKVGLHKGFLHFCSCINFGNSSLDAEAIQFMNEFGKYLDIDKIFGDKLI